MTCQIDSKKILNDFEISVFTPQIDGVIDFYCGLGFLPEEIAFEIYAALNLSAVLEMLRNAGVAIDASLRESVLAHLRQGECVEKIVRRYIQKKSYKP